MKKRVKENSFLAFMKKYVKHRVAFAATILLLLEILLVLILPPLLQLDPITSDFAHMSEAPSMLHILGTDRTGRDVFARLICGGRVSLLVGIGATLVSLIIGVPLGVLAGYYQGWVGTLIMRIVDMFLSFPSMVITLVLIAVLGPSTWTVVFVTGFLSWMQHCKLLYGSVSGVRNKEYVEAAVAIGTGDFKILTKYVIPNSISPLWVSVAFTVSTSIVFESSLSFLGAGVQPPESSWGNIIYAAQSLSTMTDTPWIWLPASLVLLFTVICINLVGEGIRDAMDPKMKRK